MIQKVKPTDKNKNYCTLYLVRHGQTKLNLQRILQGHKDSNLTREGKSQAKQVSKLLKNIKFAAIFSSDLGRAKKTAKIINADKKLALTTSKALRERQLGNYEGKKISVFLEELKQQLKKRDQLNEPQRSQYRLAEGFETNEEIMGRFITFLREVSVAYPNKNVLVVSHGGPLRLFLVHMGYAKHEDLPYGAISHTTYIKVLCDGIDFYVKEVLGIDLEHLS